jgi:hypothetical protein
MKNVHLKDEGLAKLCRLHQLRILAVPVNHLTDRGFFYVPELNRLEEFYAGGNELGNAGLAALAAMPSLQTLKIPGAKVTMAGLYAIVRKAPGRLKVIVQEGIFPADDLQKASRRNVTVEEWQ